MIDQVASNPALFALGVFVGVAIAATAGLCYFTAWRSDTVSRAARENRIVLGKAEFQVTGGRIRR